MNSNFRKYVLVVPLLMTATLWAQHKTSSAPAPKAPASHASAPAKPSTQSHSSAPSHSSTPSHSTAATHSTPSTSHTTSTHTTTTTHSTTPAGRTTTNTRSTTTNRTSTPSHTSTPAGHTATPTRSATGGSHTPPGRTVSLKGGGSASIRPNGQIRSINRNGMQINHGLHGGRSIVSTHNGARIVTTGRHGGYVQRSYVTRGGHAYYSRTYYYHGAYRVGVYRGYYWHGYNYYGYYHPYWYHPGFYGWAYNPWPAPFAWGWGWGGAPWYGYYGAYWNPYPYYAAPAFWLTDYLIAANLQAAYAAQAEANADAAAAAQAPAGDPPAQQAQGPVQLSPEVKQAIADEVKAQIQQQQADAAAAAQQPASGGGGQAAPTNAEEVPPALDPAHRTFVVADEVDTVADGQECALTQGDVITRLTDTPDQDQKVNVSIASSKKSDCASGKTVLVSVDDLQEMHNHFQEQLDAGLKEMAAKQGTGGMPKAPDTGTVASNVPAPPPDQSAGKAIDDQDKSADQTESQVKQETASGAGGSQ